MEAEYYNIVTMIAEFLNDKYSFLKFKVLTEEPMVIIMNDINEIELMSGYGDDEVEKTNYELLENIIVSVIDDIREVFDLDCDYNIGTENIVEIAMI